MSICVHMDIYIHIHTGVKIYIYLHIYVDICIYMCVYVYMYVFTCVYIYEYIHICMYICIYMNIRYLFFKDLAYIASYMLQMKDIFLLRSASAPFCVYNLFFCPSVGNYLAG